MKTTTYLLKAGKAGIVLAALTAGTLAAPMTYADDLHIGVNVGTPAPPAVVIAPDNYVYYPTYGYYYTPKRKLFAYQRDGAWVWRAAPPSVSADVVLGTPAVRMDFHDAPWNHHREVVKKYPHDWKPEHVEHRDADKEHGRDQDRR